MKHWLTNLFGLVIGAAVGLIALAAFALSYAALYALANESGVTSWLVWLWPLTLDAVVIAASGVILWNSLRNERAVYAWALSIAFTLASIWFNTEHAGADLVAKFVFALPPASLFLVTKLASAQIGAYARKRTAERSLCKLQDEIIQASAELRIAETNADEVKRLSEELIKRDTQISELSEELTRIKELRNRSAKRRLEAWERDEKKCTDCGIDLPEGSGFHCHHVIPKSIGGTSELDNLVTLCIPCHIKRHSRQGRTSKKSEFLSAWSKNGHESAAELARKMGVNERTAQLWVKEFTSNE